MTRPTVLAMIDRPSQKKLTQKSKSWLRGKMLVLELLGTLSLRDETRPVPVSAQQKRLLGLLAILAVAGKQGISRDKIEAYLWPESTGDNARHSLDQTVYSIRNALGTDFLISTGRELRLNPALVQADVWEFEEAIRAGQQAKATGVYKGPLLDGIHLADSRDLESWIDTNRNRLRFGYQTAIEHLAKVAAEAGDHAQSATWLRQLVNSDPLSSAATKRLMLALAAAGDRAAAVRQARLYQELVKQELEIEPDSEIESLAATLSRPATVESARAKAAENRPAPAEDAGGTASNQSSTPPVAVSSQEARKESSHRKRRLGYALFGLAILISGAAVWGSMHPGQSKQVVRYTLEIDSTEAMTPATPWSGRIAISPDGSRLAYTGGRSNQLLIRMRNELHATAIRGTEDASTPFFSPDGRRVGFLRERSIQIAPVGGGPLVTIPDSLTGVAGASWGRDNFIYADGFRAAPLARVEARQGSVPMWFTALDTVKGEIDHTWPEALPNGKGVLFTVTSSGRNTPTGQSSFAIAVAEIPSGKHRVILEDAVYPRYASPGRLLYVTRKGALMMVSFDQSSMSVTGDPIALIDGMRVGRFGASDLAVSSAGTLVYSVGAEQNNQELVWRTRDGKSQPVDPDWQGFFLDPSLSPDGKMLAVAKSEDGRTADIWIKHLDRGPAIKLTKEGIVNRGPTWTPDGQSVTFAGGAPNGSFALWTKRADGSGKALLQRHERRDMLGPQWSPDAKWLIFGTENADPGAGDIGGIRPGTDTGWIALLASKSEESLQALSPDGRWLAYNSNETGRFEIYVVPFPNTTAAKWAISSGGGINPMWSHRGSELFYRHVSGDLFVVGIKTSPTFSYGMPRRLFEAKRASFPFSGYAVSADDQRLLMIRLLSAGAPDKLIVVENWFEELNAKTRK